MTKNNASGSSNVVKFMGDSTEQEADPKNTRARETQDILKLLVDAYHLDHLGEVGQREGSTTQDFIDRGLAGSTLHILTALQAHIDYVANLIDYLFHQIPERFPHIPLHAFQSGLIKTAKQEYSRISNVPARLVMDSGLRPVGDVLHEFQRKVEIDLATLEAKIRTECALSAKGKNLSIGPTDSGQTRVDRFMVRIKNHPILWQLVVLGIVVIALGTFLTYFKELMQIAATLIYKIRPETVSVIFSPTHAVDLTISAETIKGIEDFSVVINIQNHGRRSLYNAKLALIHSELLNIGTPHGSTSISRVQRGNITYKLTKFELGDLYASRDTSDPNSSVVDLKLLVSMSFPTTVPSSQSNFLHTKSRRTFEIEYELTAEKYVGQSGKLLISIGTPESLKKYKRPIFTIAPDHTLIEYTP